jgi:hypothetical protein
LHVTGVVGGAVVHGGDILICRNEGEEFSESSPRKS